MVAASATTRGVDMAFLPPRTSAPIEAEVDRDPETGERPGVVERVKSAVERIRHPEG